MCLFRVNCRIRRYHRAVQSVRRQSLRVPLRSPLLRRVQGKKSYVFFARTKIRCKRAERGTALIFVRPKKVDFETGTATRPLVADNERLIIALVLLISNNNEGTRVEVRIRQCRAQALWVF